MLRTPLCDLFKIPYPIVQASLGPWSSVELVAAVSNAGGIGSVGTAIRTVPQLQHDLARLRELTGRPYIVNFTGRPFDEAVFAYALKARPAVISHASAEPGELPRRAHDAGSLFMQQVHTVEQAEQAAERGADAARYLRPLNPEPDS